MTKVIQESWTEESISYELLFDDVDHSGSGFAFPCNKNGVIDIKNMTPAGYTNYCACLTGTSTTGRRVVRAGVNKCTSSYKHPRIIECPCGAEVVLSHHFTNTCDKCDRDFDGSGHVLASREQWGEETGETYDDIVRP